MGQIPVIVLTGFLGAGKTTLLRRLLADEAFADTGVIVNEFGDVGLDHDLMRIGEREALVSAGGCICCTAAANIRVSLTDLMEVARRADRTFQRVIVETTGIADPAPVVNQIVPGGAPAMGFRDHMVARTFTLAGVACTVDAILGEIALERHRECLKQVAFADRLFITKTDQIADPASKADLVRFVQRLHTINPAASIHDINDEAFSLADAFQPHAYAPRDRSSDVERWLALASADQDHCADHDHGHGHDHHHDHDHAHDGIMTRSLVRESSVQPEDLASFLDVLSIAAGPQLLRMKGLINVADDPDRPLVLHVVQHKVHPPVRLDGWPSEDRRTRLVAITHEMDADFLERLFDGIATPSRG